MKKILCYGSINLDYVYKVPHFVTAGETLGSDSLSVVCGGKGLNQSIAAARAGAKVFHAGKVGSNGGVLRKLLDENDIDTRYLLNCDSENGHAIIQVEPSGQNCILLFPGSNHKVECDEIDACLKNFDKGDYIILQNEINNVPYIIEKAYEAGIKVVFNPSPISKDIQDYPIEKVSLLVLNEVEGMALTGEEDPTKVLAALRARYGNTDILLSRGKSGSVYYNGKETIKAGIFKVNTVDTTGAGDTMLGYFVAGIAGGKDIKEALIFAAKAAAVAVSRPGAAPSIPTYDEVLNAELNYAE